ncbi:MAG: glucose-6-phosphate isomerase [Candidatus Marinimicrobia bacterium CG_4_9_14_3_um_filter_48_9]|nr:MAG: glucose-6-phosphate isomerase [Candidatus Marinimicrobia bacterium CG_4_9_14_3_um_filter_48_9]
MKIQIDHILPFVEQKDLDNQIDRVDSLRSQVLNKSGAGADFLGWLDLPNEAQKNLDSILAVASEIRQEKAALICIGIGGSYLGARAVIDALAPESPIYFLGHHLHPDALNRILESIGNRTVYVNVISKSGTTTEPGVVFRIVKKWLEKRVGETNAARQIIATTDGSKGALHTLAVQKGYRRFVIPDDVGGRFSVLTPVGLLPIAAMGIDIKALLKGAADAEAKIHWTEREENPAVVYAAVRSLLYSLGYKVEILVNWHPDLATLAEWWKQLYGESEGKEGKGLFPASTVFTTDLHSLGQYIQEGNRILIETFLVVEKPNRDIVIDPDSENLDGLNYLTKFNLNDINLIAYQGTAEAHTNGGVPNMTLALPELSAYTLGYLIYFFEFAVALSGYSLDVNPFNQPGVEAYKTAMFKLLGKPGFTP